MKEIIKKLRAIFKDGGYHEAPNSPEGLEKLNRELKEVFRLDYTPEIQEIEEEQPDTRLRKYICNDSFEDPSNLLIDLLPLKSKKIYEKDVCIGTYHYKDYDIDTDTFSNLAIRETYTTYYHDDGKIKAQEVLIEWLQELLEGDTDEIVGISKTITNTEYFVI